MITYADLTEEERQIYIKALIATAQADQQLDDEEISFFTEIAQGIGIEPEQAQKMIQEGSLNLEEVPPMHTAAGALILRDVAAMAVVNNDLAEEEEDFIFLLGQAMQFDRDEVDEFLNWAFMGLQWQLKSVSLIQRYIQPTE